MTKSKILSLCALLAAATLTFAQTPKASRPASAAASPAARLQGLDDLAAQAMKEWKVPGVALAVVQDGRVIYVKGYGCRDLENKLPVTTATLFPISSITKSFTALTFGILKNEDRSIGTSPSAPTSRNFRCPIRSRANRPRLAIFSRIAPVFRATTSFGIPPTSAAKTWSAACAISNPTRAFAAPISTTISRS